MERIAKKLTAYKHTAYCLKIIQLRHYARFLV